jgi:predicted transcriptional regulator
MPTTISDLMTQPPLIVHEKSKIRDAVQLLLSDCAPQIDVVDEDGRLVGSIPDYELLKAQMAGEDEMPVTRVMSCSGVRLDAEATADFAAGVFRDGRYQRLPVVQNERVVGQIDRRDVMRLLNASSFLQESVEPAVAGEMRNQSATADQPETAIRGPRYSRVPTRRRLESLSQC